MNSAPVLLVVNVKVVSSVSVHVTILPLAVLMVAAFDTEETACTVCPVFFKVGEIMGIQLISGTLDYNISGNLKIALP